MLFIDGTDGLDPKLESEADAFARDLLIPSDKAAKLSQLTNQTAITAFAAESGIAPGIVVGRMQKEGLIKWSDFNQLKQRYIWQHPTDSGDAG